jgi:hypothetical protein
MSVMSSQRVFCSPCWYPCMPEPENHCPILQRARTVVDSNWLGVCRWCHFWRDRSHNTYSHGGVVRGKLGEVFKVLVISSGSIIGQAAEPKGDPEGMHAKRQQERKRKSSKSVLS